MKLVKPLQKSQDLSTDLVNEDDGHTEVKKHVRNIENLLRSKNGTPE